MVADAESDVLHTTAAHVFSVLFGRNPNGLLKESDGLIVAAAAHRIDDDDVGETAIRFDHKTQTHRALDFSFLGLGREFQVFGDVLGHVAAVRKIRLGHLFKLFVFVYFIRGVGFESGGE